jgi:hypothetical protein
MNYLALFVAAVAMMALGFVWYAKPVFGKAWMKLLGKKEEDMDKSGMPVVFLVMFVLTLVEVCVLSHVLDFAGAVSAVDGIRTGAWMWLGFVLPTMGSGYLFLKKSWKLFAIDAGYHLVGLALMGAILGVWR